LACHMDLVSLDIRDRFSMNEWSGSALDRPHIASCHAANEHDQRRDRREGRQDSDPSFSRTPAGAGEPPSYCQRIFERPSDGRYPFPVPARFPTRDHTCYLAHVRLPDVCRKHSLGAGSDQSTEWTSTHSTSGVPRAAVVGEAGDPHRHVDRGHPAGGGYSDYTSNSLGR
jgi:hypothetical protein